MELYQLRFFKAVAENKTLTEASRVVNVTQPSLSRAIKKLEEEYGVELFDRVGRNMVLNENGKVFLAAANRTLDAASAIAGSMQHYLNEKALTLNLFAPFPLGMEASLLGTFQKENPDILTRYARSYVSSLGNDIADVRFHVSVKDYPDGICVGEERIVAFLPKNHPLASRKSISFTELADEAFVSVLPCPIRQMFDSMCEATGLKPRIILEDQNCQHISDYVAQGLGVAVGADITWIADGQDDMVALVPIKEFRRSRHLYLLKEASSWPPASLKLADFMTSWYRSRRDILDQRYSAR